MKKSLLLIAALAGTLMASAQIAEVGPRVQVNAAAAQRMAVRAAQNTPVIEADNVLRAQIDRCRKRHSCSAQVAIINRHLYTHKKCYQRFL